MYTVHEVLHRQRQSFRVRGLTAMIPALDDLEELLGGDLALSDEAARFLAATIPASDVNGLSALLLDVALDLGQPASLSRPSTRRPGWRAPEPTPA
jgi:hypothetical protein